MNSKKQLSFSRGYCVSGDSSFHYEGYDLMCCEAAFLGKYQKSL